MFSQKQIYDIAKHPNSLLKIIDSTPQVNRFIWKLDWDEARNKFLQARIKYRDLNLKIKQKGDIVGQLADVNRKINLIEKSGHAKILVGYSSVENRVSAIVAFKKSISDALCEIKKMHEIIEFENIDKEYFLDDSIVDSEAVSQSQSLYDKMLFVRSEISKLIDFGEIEIEKYNTWIANSKIKAEYKLMVEQYDSHVKLLREAGITNPNEYQLLLTSRKDLELKLKEITNYEVELNKTNQEVKSIYLELVVLRGVLTKKRQDFIHEILHENELVNVTIVPFCDEQFLNSDFRKIISREDGAFSNDILNDDDDIKSGILHLLNKRILECGGEIEKSISIINQFKKEFNLKGQSNILGHSLSKRFIDFKDALTPEVLDQVYCWFPEDAVRVRYADGKRMRDISQGSAGQKAATILSFLLSYGDEPLVLDQPEDDLDNQLIYDLIVKRIQDNKSKRQIIIVTHNPNIVVNGDSELVISLNEVGGFSEILCMSGLQDLEVRKSVCDIMEGGKVALQQRYRRIMNA